MARIDQVFYRVIDRGGESVAANLERALTERGHDVACVGFFRDRLDDTPVTGHWTILVPERTSARATLRALGRWVRRIRRRRPEVVVAHTQVASLLALPLALLLGVRRRISVHHQPHGRDLGWPFYVSDAIAGWLGIYTDVVLVSHQGLDAIHRFPRRYKRRVTLIPNQVPPVPLPERSLARARLGLDADERVFCFVGALTVRKGADVAARAVAGAPAGVLLLAGREGDASEAVERLAESSGGRLRPLGHLPKDEIIDVLASSDALLFPTRAENRSLTLLEALSAGLAVVVSDIRGNRDVLAEGEGRLIDPDDQAGWDKAVVELLDGERLAAERPASDDRARYETMIDDYERVLLGRGVVAAGTGAVGSAGAGGP